MMFSGLYFVSNPANSLDAAVAIANTLSQGIEANYPIAARQPPWTLQYRVFRDIVPPGSSAIDAGGRPTPSVHALQHHLHLSSLDPTCTYVYCQPVQGEGVVTALSRQQQETQALFVRTQMAALWQPRHVLSLLQGNSYRAGMCTIQIGELRSTREGPQSSGIQSPGVVVCISAAVGSDSSEESDDMLHAPQEQDPTAYTNGTIDFEYAQTIVRDCWSKVKDNKDLGRSEVKEVMMAPNAENEKEAAVRMWCEVLRLRG